MKILYKLESQQQNFTSSLPSQRSDIQLRIHWIQLCDSSSAVQRSHVLGTCHLDHKETPMALSPGPQRDSNGMSPGPQRDSHGILTWTTKRLPWHCHLDHKETPMALSPGPQRDSHGIVTWTTKRLPWHVTWTTKRLPWHCHLDHKETPMALSPGPQRDSYGIVTWTTKRLPWHCHLDHKETPMANHAFFRNWMMCNGDETQGPCVWRQNRNCFSSCRGRVYLTVYKDMIGEGGNVYKSHDLISLF